MVPHDLSHFAGLEEVPVFRAPFSARAEKLDRVLVDAMVEFGLNEPKGKRMSRMSEIGARIAQKHARHNAKAEEWAARLDKLDAAEPTAFAVGDAVVAEQEQNLRQFESDMKVLSNLPLAGSAGSGSDSSGKQGG